MEDQSQLWSCQTGTAFSTASCTNVAASNGEKKENKSEYSSLTIAFVRPQKTTKIAIAFIMMATVMRSTSVRKCSQGTSWQDVLNAEKCIDVFMVTKAKSNWLDLLLRMQKATSCRYLLILGIKLLLQKFDANLAISNPRYLELFFDTLESSR